MASNSSSDTNQATLSVDHSSDIDKATLLDNQQAPDVVLQYSGEPATYAHTGRPYGQQLLEAVYRPSGDSSKLRTSVNISSPELFTGASPLSVDLTGQVLTRGPSLAKRLRSRLPSVNIVLACVAFWLCGFVFGIIAFVLECDSRAKLSSGSVDNRKKAQRLRKASCVVSIVGFVVGVVVIVTCSIVIPLQIRHLNYYDYNYLWSDDGSPTHDISPERCRSLGHYFVAGKCYRFQTFMSCSSCLARAGQYIEGACSYNKYKCPGHSLIGISSTYSNNYETCFSSRRPASDHKCPANELYIADYCYYTSIPDCNGGYFVGCECYSQKSTTFTKNTCNNIGGSHNTGNSYSYYSEDGQQVEINGNTCYYNSFDCSGYSVNGQCYSNYTSAYTSGTCNNIGGYMETSSGLCYNDGFKNCHYGLARYGQCFGSSIQTPTSSSCRNMGGYHEKTHPTERCLGSIDCYFYDTVSSDDELALKCNSSYFIASQRLCEANSSMHYSWSECRDLDGYHNDTTDYCYYTTINCTGFAIGCVCYKYRNSTMSSTTCESIGGFLYHQACYYSSSSCTYYEFRGQCYSYRRSVPNESSCSGAYDSFFSICYSN